MCDLSYRCQPGFYKGVAGSQVTLSSLVNQSRAMLEEQARLLLTEAERQTMSYYVEEYRDGHVGIEQLVMALFELLNTHAKVSHEHADQRRVSVSLSRDLYRTCCGAGSEASRGLQQGGFYLLPFESHHPRLLRVS